MSRFKLSIASLAMVLVLASQTFAAAPTISSISPTNVLAGTGTFTLTVNGANYMAPAVYWNSTPLPLSYASPTMLRATVPNTFFTAPGTVTITVIAAGIRSNGVSFTIISPMAPPPTTSTTTTLGISTTSIPNGTAGAPYSATLSATGGTPNYVWLVSSGALPPGLAMSASTSASVAIAGTPTASGSFSFTAQIKDSAGHSATQTYSTSIGVATTTTMVSSAPPPSSSPSPLAITSTSIPNGVAGIAYGTTLTASGGVSPYTWAIVSGTLPPGLTLASGGAISGTPSMIGSYSFVAQVKDAASNGATQTYSTSVVAPTSSASGPSGSTGPAPLAITQLNPMSGTVGTAFSIPFPATGGTTPYTWSVVGGTLPPGLTLSSAGVLSGTPAASGTFSFTGQVQDSGSQVAQYVYTCVIN